MFDTQTPLLEVVARVVILYLALLVFVRFAGKREVGELGPMELLSMLLLSETVSPALTAQDTSLPASLVAAATLLGLTGIVGRLTYHSRRMERVIEGTPADLISDGVVNERTCRRERISKQELEAALRKEGVETVDDVKAAYVEPTGRITVIPRR
jgi:uncharacterized membrane protein YcaP (DUF421 family)